MIKCPEQMLVPADKRQAIVASAAQVFVRYGFARVTMAGLAAAAGLSRTALYPLFANKADLFDAVVRDQAEVAACTIRDRLAEQTDRAAKQHFACRHAIVNGSMFVRRLRPSSFDANSEAFVRQHRPKETVRGATDADRGFPGAPAGIDVSSAGRKIHA